MHNNPTEILQWLAEMGDDLALAEAPIDRFSESEAHKKAAQARKATPGRPSLEARMRQAAEAGAGQQQGRGSAKRAVRGATLPDEAAMHSARQLAEGADTLDALREALAGFTGCNLRLTAKNLVFADGNPEARVMFIGEAPGRDEDLQGLPFVGRSGQLLDRMLAAIGLDRQTAYITNIIPWRPPGNRTPTPAESELCRPFIERHIELAGPEVVVMLGGASAKALLMSTDGILRLRGRWMKLNVGKREFDALATLHPAYLLRQPAQKKLAWHDFLKIKARLSKIAD